MPTSKVFVRLEWKDPNSGRTQKFNDYAPITIGRDSENQVTLNDNRVSGRHAFITTTDEEDVRVVIVDNQSTNGTRVGGKSIRQHVLAIGDNFTIGPYTLTIEYETIKIKPGVRYVQCSNPQCRRIVQLTEYDCPWCGYNLGNSDTIPAVS